MGVGYREAGATVLERGRLVAGERRRQWLSGREAAIAVEKKVARVAARIDGGLR